MVFAPELINSCDFLSGKNTRDIFCSEEILGWLLDGGWSRERQNYDSKVGIFQLHPSPSRETGAKNVADSRYEEVSIKIPPFF